MDGTPHKPDETDWRAVFAALAGGIASALQIGKVSGALPLLRTEFATDVQTMSIYVAVISFVAASVGFWFGTLTRRFDPRRVSQLGLGITAIGAVASVAAPSAGALLASRAIEAVGFSMTATSLPLIIQAAAARRHKALALGIWSTWMPAGIGCALALSWLLIEGAGWRAVYTITGMALVAAALGLQVFVPQRLHPFDGPTLTASPTVVLRPEPIKVTVVFFSFSACSLIMLGFLPTILVDDLGMGEAAAAAITMLAAFGMLPTNVLAGWLLDRGARARTLCLLSLAGIGISALLVTSDAVPTPLRLGAILMFSISAGVTPGVVWASITPLARHPGEAPLLSGLFYQGAGLGQVAGPIAAGSAFVLFAGWHGAGWTVAGFIALALVAATAMRRTDG